jgi:hypothetical protein
MSLGVGSVLSRLTSSARSRSFSLALDSAASLASSALLCESVSLMIFLKNLVFGFIVLDGLSLRQNIASYVESRTVLLSFGVESFQTHCGVFYRAVAGLFGQKASDIFVGEKFVVWHEKSRIERLVRYENSCDVRDVTANLDQIVEENRVQQAIRKVDSAHETPVDKISSACIAALNCIGLHVNTMLQLSFTGAGYTRPRRERKTLTVINCSARWCSTTKLQNEHQNTRKGARDSAPSPGEK